MSNCFNWPAHLRHHSCQAGWDFSCVSSPGQLTKQGGSFLDQLFHLILVCTNIHLRRSSSHSVYIERGDSISSHSLLWFSFFSNFGGYAFTWCDREPSGLEWCYAYDVVALWSSFKLYILLGSNSEVMNENYDDPLEQTTSELLRVSVVSTLEVC